MANADRPNGFTPMRHLMGGIIRPSEYRINTSGTTGFDDDIRSGDVVKMNTDGTIELAAGGDTVLLGVFYGCNYVDSTGEIQFSRRWPASTAVLAGSVIRAYVYDDPNITYRVQTVSGTNFVSTMEGANADFVYAAGSNFTGQSASELAIGTITTADGNFRILRLIEEPDNNYGENHAKVEVRFNEHLYLSAVGV